MIFSYSKVNALFLLKQRNEVISKSNEEKRFPFLFT